MYKEFFAITKPAIVVRGSDSIPSLQMLVARLKECGCDVTVVASDSAMPDWDTGFVFAWLPDGAAASAQLAKLTGQYPFIALIESQSAVDRVAALQAGADDVLSVPFDLEECLLRAAMALHRRHAITAMKDSSGQVHIDSLWMQQHTQRVRIDNTPVKLTPLQFDLLWILAQHKGTTLSKPLLYRQVLKKAYSPDDRSLDMHLSRVRKKLSDVGFPPERLQTDHGKGYCFI
ncbi:response regulator transcription factor [Salinivibrio sp. ES.052]|uniref:response regulator transcription factor n=1 Tax=Salinivibrio sp. ES.052 TaxID=1882823 RepID=UPI000925A054|nr:response regulator transcription factor [Salinivibrio sp. ES.052]SIN88733.1 two-component system, OmpR family, response regulator PfeR [Salinivibrio sp. ES.052]